MRWEKEREAWVAERSEIEAGHSETRLRVTIGRGAFECAGQTFDIFYDLLEREMLTEEIEELHGKSVIIRGFILDSSIFQQKGIEQFVLVRDNQICCFGPGAKIHHNIQVDMDEGKTADFTFRPVEIRGTLKIQPWILPADGKCYSVYHVQAASVKPTQ